MPLPDPNLDDLRFQKDLVDEARLRIIRYCPEWTDYNLSDPGITLIELFAWMTEQIVYRLNRVPDKNYIRFMDMLGFQLQPASSARTPLTFRLSAPLPLGPGVDTVAVVAKGIEVATLPSDDAPEVIFTTDSKLTISPPPLTELRRDLDFNKNYLPRMGIETFYAFQPEPQPGDTFYIGFADSIDLKGHILRLTFTCESTRGTGIKREDPPLVWECSLGENRWHEILPSTRHDEKDTTGGLNNPRGSITFYLPLELMPDQVYGRTALWIRCRFEPRRPEQGVYSQPPRIINVEAHALGGTVFATNAVYVYDEPLGTSTGDPGQVFQLNHAPILELLPDEQVLVEEFKEGDWVMVPWQYVTDFSVSTRYDRHFTVDATTGQIGFGPAVRQPDGSVKQYGRVPEVGRKISLNSYRYGGGVAGNVPTGKIQVLRTAIPYIDQVTNLEPATGGRDQESLEEAKYRARRELRAQQRAVTAEDFEDLARQATRQLARVKCNAPGKTGTGLPGGMIELLLVPAATESVRRGDLSALRVDPFLKDTVRAHLDQYRLLTTTMHLREPAYVGVKVYAEIVIGEYHNPETVRLRVLDALRNYIAPLPLTLRGEPPPPILGADWQGWDFGRDLYRAEIYSLVQQVQGVKHILEVKYWVRPIIPAEEIALASPETAASQSTADLTLIADRRISAAPDTLFCSLNHDVVVVTL